MKKLLIAIAVYTYAINAVWAADIEILMTKPFDSLPQHPEVQMLTVEYAPGEFSAPHRHHAHTFVYVLEGVVEMQVSGGDLVRLVAGDTFYESPEDIHAVSRNASNEAPAKVVVFFLKSADAPTTVPVDESIL